LADAFGQPVDASRRVVSRAVPLFAALIKMLGPANGFRIAGLQEVKRKRLPVFREVSLEEAPQLVPIEPGRLLLEVQERPELEAGVRDCQLDSTVASLLSGIVKPGVVVHVEHAPDFVIAQEVITAPPGFPLCLPLHR
jgi:hypothetical protein